MGIGLASIALCLVLVGSTVLARRRRGEPVGRHALFWAAIFLGLFAVAMLLDRQGAR